METLVLTIISTSRGHLSTSRKMSIKDALIRVTFACAFCCTCPFYPCAVTTSLSRKFKIFSIEKKIKTRTRQKNLRLRKLAFSLSKLAKKVSVSSELIKAFNVLSPQLRRFEIYLSEIIFSARTLRIWRELLGQVYAGLARQPTPCACGLSSSTRRGYTASERKRRRARKRLKVLAFHWEASLTTQMQWVVTLGVCTSLT